MYDAERTIFLNKLAKRLKDLYTQIKKRENRLYCCSSKFDECWMKVAMVVDQLQADPILYLESQFLIPSTGKIFPTHLYGEAAISRYKSVLGRDNPFQQKLDNQVFYLKRCLETYPDRSIDDVLLDKRMPFKNFFRVIMCSQSICNQVIEKYGEGAKEELEFDPGLKQLIEKQYETRYRRIFPKRLSNRTSVQHIEDPGPPSKTIPGRNYPRRRKG
jgi:hypothetical protein